MFLDASALVAILAHEEDALTLAARVEAVDRKFTSALSIYEAVLGLARARNMPVSSSEEAVTRYLSAIGTEIVAITAEIGSSALHAFERFGRGRHPARLSMGDCLAYAAARMLGVPLLWKGGDFTLTDIAPA